jgi:hypothetical protein
VTHLDLEVNNLFPEVLGDSSDLVVALVARPVLQSSSNGIVGRVLSEVGEPESGIALSWEYIWNPGKLIMVSNRPNIQLDFSKSSQEFNSQDHRNPKQ